MISFAATIFLAGTALVAVPVILHFLRRKPTDKMPFPSFFFLQAVDSVVDRKVNDLKKWLVLALRVLAILALCAAFALPFIPSFSPRVNRAAVILVDGTMSMQASSASQAMVFEVLFRQPQTAVMVGIVADTVIWSGDFTDRPGKLRDFVLLRGTTEAGGTYEVALRAADRQLQRQPFQDKTIYLIGDMQKQAWKNVRLDAPLSPGVKIKVISVPNREPELNNAWLTEPKADFTADGQLQVSVTAVNGGREMINGTLEITAGEQRRTMPVKLAPAERRTVTAQLPVKAGTETLGGTAVLQVEDALPADNRCYFMAQRKAALRIAMTPPEKGKFDFVRAALQPAPVTYLDAVAPEVVSGSADVLIVRSGYGFNVERLERLYSAVRSGCGLVLCWENSPSMNKVFEKFGIRVVKPEKAPGKALLLTDIDFEQPPFKKFTTGRTGALYDTVFHKVPQLQLPDSAERLASFAADAPAVGVFPCGNGLVYVLAFAPDRNGTDWPARATFLPFWQELIKLFKPVEKGDRRLTASLKTAASGVTAVTRCDSGGSTAMPVEGGRFVPSRAGLYQVDFADGRHELFCVNVAPEESLLRYMPADFNPAAALTNPQAAAANDSGWPEGPGRQLFWIFLTLALVCAGAELLLANRTAL